MCGCVGVWVRGRVVANQCVQRLHICVDACDKDVGRLPTPACVYSHLRACAYSF